MARNGRCEEIGLRRRFRQVVAPAHSRERAGVPGGEAKGYDLRQKVDTRQAVIRGRSLWRRQQKRRTMFSHGNDSQGKHLRHTLPLKHTATWAQKEVFGRRLNPYPKQDRF